MVVCRSRFVENETLSMRVDNFNETSFENFCLPTSGRGTLLPLSGWEALVCADENNTSFK